MKVNPRFNHWIDYLITALAVVITGLIAYPVASFLGYQTIGLIFLALISFMPLKFGIGPILVSAALSALIWDFFFIPPRFTITIGEAEDLMMLSVYFIFAVVSSYLAARSRTREAMLYLREKKAVALYTLTQRLSLASSGNEVIRQAVDNIENYFQTRVSIHLSETYGDRTLKAHPMSTLPVEAIDGRLLNRVLDSQLKIGPVQDASLPCCLLYLPLPGPRFPLGVMVVDISNPSLQDREQLSLLDNFSAQISSAIEREALNELNKKNIILKESERLYRTLFNSISHELMTPLAAIISSFDGLGDGLVNCRTELAGAYLHEIQIAAGRLNLLVKNLLDMSRLESGFLQPKLDWCDANDLFFSVSRRLSGELSGHRFRISLPADLPLFQADSTLLEQAIVNIVQNACIHNPKGTDILLSADILEQRVRIIVTDNGPSLPADVLPHVFEKFYRAPGSRQGGTGLGLSIAKGFMEAHKGSIEAENLPDGGKRFILTLPGPVNPLVQEV